MTTPSRVCVIAEIGVNHNGSMRMARAMIRAAMAAGADAVKFQSFKVDRLIVAGTAKAEYQQRNTEQNSSQDEMLRALELSAAKQGELRRYARAQKVEFLSSPFDEESLKELERLRVRRLKLPSGEITNGPLLLAAARSRLPILLSTGMASLGEVEASLAVLAWGRRHASGRPTPAALEDVLGDRQAWDDLGDVTLLHCTTQYPTPFPDVNLRAMQTMASAFGLPVGYSDHTHGIAVSVAAVAMGARVIEKHFTLDRSLPGPDHRASLEPAEFADLVRSIREVESSLGDGRKRCLPTERSNRRVARKSLVALVDIRAGEKFTKANIGSKRPGLGRSPMKFWGILGTRATENRRSDERI